MIIFKSTFLSIFLLTSCLNLWALTLDPDAFKTNLTTTSEAVKIDTNLNQIFIGSEIVKIAPAQYHTLIGENNTIATIAKSPAFDLITARSNAVSRIANLQATGLIKMPKHKGKSLYTVTQGGTYNLLDSVDYFLSLSDSELYEALQRGLVGKCQLINRNYLSHGLRNRFAIDHALFVPEAKAITAVSSLPPQILPIAGAFTLDRKLVPCLNRYFADVCSKPTLKQRITSLLRQKLSETRQNPSDDVCDIGSVVSELNKSQLQGIDVDTMYDSKNIAYFNDHGKVRCFWKIKSSQAYTYGEGQVLDVDNLGAAIELNPRSCKFVAYRKMRLTADGSQLGKFAGASAWEVPKATGSFGTALGGFDGRTLNLSLEAIFANRHKILELNIRNILDETTMDKIDTLAGIDIGKITAGMTGPIEIVVDPRIDPIPFQAFDYIGQFNQDFTNLSTNFTNLSTSFGTLNNSVTSLQGNVSGIQSNVNTLSSDVSSINGSVSTLGNNVNDIASSLSSNGYTFSWIGTFQVSPMLYTTP